MSALAVLTPAEVSAMLAGRRVARAIRVAQLAEDVRVIAELELIASLDVPPLPRRVPSGEPRLATYVVGWPPPNGVENVENNDATRIIIGRLLQVRRTRQATS